MIVLFTSNIAGGIVQFITQIVSELIDMGYEVTAFIPNEAKVSLDKKYIENVRKYKKVKSINRYDRNIRDLATEIENLNPKWVWYFDNGILSTEIGLNLNGKVHQILTMHDAGGAHPSNNNSIRKKIHRLFEYRMSKSFEKRVEKVLVLSEESKKKYINLNPDFTAKAMKMNLGAHVPNVTPRKVKEDIRMPYILFFGRIDKYKGIENLLKAYAKYAGKYKLVIAGNGKLSLSEEDLIKKEPRVTLINRYIEDCEMLWLFENSKALILPYLEATQSGIIPIAYKYSKPVVVSSVDGLTQFVVDKKTGFICKSSFEYIKAFTWLEEEDTYKKMQEACKAYYNDKLEWKNNLNRLLFELKK